MPTVSVFEATPGARHSTHQVHHLELADVPRRRLAVPRSAYLRVWGRDDDEDVATVAFTRAVLRVLAQLSGPNSALRNRLAHAHPRQRVQWFTFSRAALRPLLHGGGDDAAWEHIAALLTTARPAHREGDLLVEVGDAVNEAVADAAGAVRSATALVDQVWQDVAPEETPAAVAEPARAAAVRPTPAERSRAFRERLLDEHQGRWLSSAALADRWHSQATNKAQMANELRRQGRLLGAWSTRDGAYLHPDFQFDAAGELRPEVAGLLAALAPLNADERGDRGGWRRLFWLYAPNRRLDDQRPADVFAANPDRVIDAAYAEHEALRRLP